MEVNKKVSRTYRLIMGGCAFISGAVALAYIAVTAIALGDGIGRGIEIPKEVNILACIIIVLTGTIAAEAWLSHRAARENLRPLIRDEVERVSARNSAIIRNIIATEFAEVVEAAIKRAQRSGMIAQAQAAGQLGVARVVKMRLVDED
jgi:hypothetical protein